MITIVVTVIIVVVAANAVVAVVTFIFTVEISNAGEIAVLTLVAVNNVDAAFSCVAGSAA